jgi:hypothetical protein
MSLRKLRALMKLRGAERARRNGEGRANGGQFAEVM